MVKKVGKQQRSKQTGCDLCWKVLDPAHLLFYAHLLCMITQSKYCYWLVVLGCLRDGDAVAHSVFFVVVFLTDRLQIYHCVFFVAIPCHTSPSMRYHAWNNNLNYLITWNFRDTFISRFWGSHISRHLNFAILRKFCILSHFNFAFLSETQFISLSILFNMSLNLIKLNQQSK